MSELYIGLMSGTSVDAIDAALVDLASAPALIASHSHSIPPRIQAEIAALCTPGDNEIDRLGNLDVAIGEHFSKAALALLQSAGVNASDVIAIGSHGQTVRHRPPRGSAAGFTLQIGDPNVIAHRTGITTIADFRRRDMAAGGQGAPLAPAFHQAIAPAETPTCAFLNLGGIANITLVHQGEILCGFDAGPANTLMDTWTREQISQPFDRSGAWASTGTIHQQLLEQLKADAYFALAPPKSTGREQFSRAWLQSQLDAVQTRVDAVDVQATLLQLSVDTVCNAIESLDQEPEALFVCGGGSHNDFMMSRIRDRIERNGIRVSTTSELGVPPDWVEACAFAALARNNIHRCAVDLRAVTGAKSKVVLGARYDAA